MNILNLLVSVSNILLTNTETVYVNMYFLVTFIWFWSLTRGKKCLVNLIFCWSITITSTIELSYVESFINCLSGLLKRTFMFKLQIASQHVLLLITHEIARAKTKQFEEMFFAKKNRNYGTGYCCRLNWLIVWRIWRKICVFSITCDIFNDRKFAVPSLWWLKQMSLFQIEVTSLLLFCHLKAWKQQHKN